MKKLSSLTIFFPSLNDAPSLPNLVKKADEIAKKVSDDYEIIIINDGSTDNTKEVLKKLEKNHPHLKSIHHEKNRGYGGALISGFTNAHKDWVFYTDGDGQYDPEELALLVKIANKADVLNGYKISREDGITRKYVGLIYNSLLHLLYAIPISDLDCDFRLIKKSFLKKITLESTSGFICLELILKLKKVGATFAEMGVHHYPRLHGKSEFFKLHHLWNTLKSHLSFYIKYKLKKI